jgi:inner membrane protein
VTALCCIGLLDLLGSLVRMPVLVEGVRDEIAHALTAALFLAVAPRVAERFVAWVLVGAVVIDLDHIPLFVWGVGSAGYGRPVTHSLGTILVLLAVAGLYRRWRTPLLALALGVLLHFLRDIATGPGLPLVWPISADNFLVPYLPYVAVLIAVTGVATGRRAGWRRAGLSRR